MTYHTKQVPCDGQTEKLTCGCEHCLVCGTYTMPITNNVTGNNLHMHLPVVTFQ